MAKKKRRNSFDLKHLKNLNKSVKEVSDLYIEAQNELIKIGLLSSHLSKGEEGYSFKDYPELDKLVNARLKTLRSDIVTVIENGELAAWELSNAKNDAMVKSLAAMTHIDISNFAGCMGRNLDALAAFQSRKINGMGLSSNVWNMCKTFKKEMELALSVGMKDGASAAEMSKDVRHLLKYPDKLFRRVKDKETGKLTLSKAAKAFHPGRGVYRSSYKNALRLTATESNMAYRTADHERWQQMSFVTGIEIETSNRHKKELVTDICDDLAGVYPKSFKFVGWHPFCRCFATPKLASVDDFEAYLRDKNADEYTPKDGEVVKEVPEKFTKWLEVNAERIASANSLPYFLRDNEWAWKKGGINLNEDAAETINDIMQEAGTAFNTYELKNKKARHKAKEEMIIKSVTGRTKKEIEQELSAKYETARKEFEKEKEELFSKLEAVRPKAEKAIYEENKEKIENWIKGELAGMPWTYEEKKAMAINWVEIEKTLGIKKKKCMTYDEANNKKENPHFNEGKEYQINCQSCVPTHILRRWGFDVEARDNKKDEVFKRLDKCLAGWNTIFKGKSKDSFAYYDFTKELTEAEGKELIELINKNLSSEVNIFGIRDTYREYKDAVKRFKFCKDGIKQQDGIYEIYCGWANKKSAHVFAAEVKKGEVSFFDPQTGKKFTEVEAIKGYFKRMNNIVGFLRIDNAPIRPEVIKTMILSK